MFKDKSGRDVEVGDLIIYSTSSKYEDNMRFGKVLEVHDRSLAVRGSQYDYKGHYIGKQVELSFPGRMLILERHQIPQPILALFDAVVVSEPFGLASESPEIIGEIKATWVSDAPEITSGCIK